jgi:glycosyltransferase involved in cell wall biosynthesis
MGEHKRNKGRRRLTVAVCVPTIPGREEDLMRATISVMQQTRQPDQFIIEVDDDRTGAAATRNRLLANVTTDVIAWLDDDDLLAPSHLRACMRVLEQSPFHPDLVYPRPKMINGRDPTAVTHQGVFPTSPWGLRFTEEFAAHIRQVGSFIPITHLVRTEAVRKIGGFPEGETLPDGRYRGEDEAYLIKLLDDGATFEHLDRSTWFWRTNPASTAGRGNGVNHAHT